MKLCLTHSVPSIKIQLKIRTLKPCVMKGMTVKSSKGNVFLIAAFRCQFIFSSHFKIDNTLGTLYIADWFNLQQKSMWYCCLADGKIQLPDVVYSVGRKIMKNGFVVSLYPGWFWLRFTIKAIGFLRRSHLYLNVSDFGSWAYDWSTHHSGEDVFREVGSSKATFDKLWREVRIRHMIV